MWIPLPYPQSSLTLGLIATAIMTATITQAQTSSAALATMNVITLAVMGLGWLSHRCLALFLGSFFGVGLLGAGAGGEEQLLLGNKLLRRLTITITIRTRL